MVTNALAMRSMEGAEISKVCWIETFFGIVEEFMLFCKLMKSGLRIFIAPTMIEYPGSRSRFIVSSYPIWQSFYFCFYFL